MVKEIWMQINGYPSYYISNMGRVKSHRFKNPKILNPVLHRFGYLQVGLFDSDGKQLTHRIHKIVASHFVPNPENDKVVLHLNNNKQDNRSSNLLWSTSKRNNDDAIKDGITNRAKGSAVAASKLTSQQVLEIMKLSMPSRKIGEIYKVSHHSILQIKRGETWNHVTKLPFTGKRIIKSVNFSS